MSATKVLTLRLFLLHWFSCLALVLLTYNPFGHSFYHWVLAGPEELFMKTLTGLAITFAFVFLAWVIFGSMRLPGVTLGLIVWWLMVRELLQLAPTDAATLRSLMSLVCLATLLAGGLSWPHFKIRLTGQIEKRYLIKTKKAA